MEESYSKRPNAFIETEWVFVNKEADIRGKKILFLVDIFPPHFAPRALSVINQFVALGAECTVFTEQISASKATAHGAVFCDVKDPCPVFRLNLRKRHSKIESVCQALWEVKDKLFARLVEKSTEVYHYDLIMAFAYRNFPLRAAAILAQRYQKPLFCDCRDLVEQYSGYSFLPSIPNYPPYIYRLPLRLLRRRLIALRNQVLRRANTITTVSPWHAALLTNAVDTLDKKVYCLYNGYEESLFRPDQKPTTHFRIVFTGRIMSFGMRDPSLLFRALEDDELVELVRSGTLEVCWYTDPHSRRLLESLLKQYSVHTQAAQKFYNMVPFSQVGKILHNAAVILLLGNKEAKGGPHGIVSTKIFEAMALEKPILSLPSDDAMCTELIATSRSGISTSEIDEVKRFLKDCYKDWKKNGYTCTPDTDRQFVRQFTRARIANAFARLSERLIK